MGDINVSYSIAGMSQNNETSCWATALAMMINYNKSTQYTPESMAQEAGYSTEACNGWDAIYACATHYGLTVEPGGQNLNVQGWADLLQSHGPLWMVVQGDPSHAVVLSGMSGDGSVDATTVTVTDPWQGEYQTNFREMANIFEIAGDAVGSNSQIIHG